MAGYGPDPAGARLRRVDSPGQLVSAGGGAVVAVAKVGRILGRSGWRIARQLPGAQAVEREAQRWQRVAVQEVRRILDIPQAVFGVASVEETRAVLLIQNSTDGQPLRSAMGELLDRATGRSAATGQDYLFGTILSQLVPDEARLIAALADGQPRAAVDVLDKSRSPRVLLACASRIGQEAGVTDARHTPTYLARLRGLGLLDLGPPLEGAERDYEALARDEAVRAAQASARRPAATRLRRTSVRLSALGEQFWAASDPDVAAPR
ncbi:MAG: DUF4393 domain-containing protein [Jatrophihabitans sp.]|nr:MAG: DUF4393 domain-containing protein [Jatrophihabitans sp.]